MHKAEKYLDKIIAAQDRDSSIEVLRELAADLGIGQSYGKLLYLKERLDLHKKAFRDLQASFKEQVVPDLRFLQDLRMEATYAYQEVVDDLFDIPRLKIAYDSNKKSEVRSTILTELILDEDFKTKHKAKSISALKEVYADHNSYREWMSCSALSYSLWDSYKETLEYIRFFIDGLASKIRTEQSATRMDLK